MKFDFKLLILPIWALSYGLIVPVTINAMTPMEHEGFFENKPTESARKEVTELPRIDVQGVFESVQVPQAAEDNPFLGTLSGDLTGVEERSSLISNLDKAGRSIAEVSKSDIITVEKSTPALYKRVAENVRGLVDVLRAIDLKSVSIAAREQINKVLDLLIQLGSKIANLTSKSSAAEREKIRHSVDATEKEFEKLVPLLPSEVMQQMRERAKPVFQNARNSLVILT